MYADTLLFDFTEIKKLGKDLPHKKVAVSVPQIYIQIAKYKGNPCRVEELAIMGKALSGFESRGKRTEPKYVMMEVEEIEKCFGKNLGKLPRGTFIGIRNRRENVAAIENKVLLLNQEN